MSKDKCASIRALLNDDDNIDEIMKADDIYIRSADLEASVPAFALCSLKKDRNYIVLGKHLSDKAKKEHTFHELSHIIKDMPNIEGTVIGLDMQGTKLEIQADEFFKEAQAKYKARQD